MVFRTCLRWRVRENAPIPRPIQEVRKVGCADGREVDPFADPGFFTRAGGRYGYCLCLEGRDKMKDMFSRNVEKTLTSLVNNEGRSVEIGHARGSWVS